MVFRWLGGSKVALDCIMASFLLKHAIPKVPGSHVLLQDLSWKPGLHRHCPSLGAHINNFTIKSACI